MMCNDTEVIGVIDQIKPGVLCKKESASFHKPQSWAGTSFFTEKNFPSYKCIRDKYGAPETEQDKYLCHKLS